MTPKLFKLFAEFWAKGFRPYTGEIQSSVYAALGCLDSKKAYWIVDWPMLYCLGCKRRCVPKSHVGFQIQLPKRDLPSLTIAQLLDLGRPLSVEETARCLNMSIRQVYRSRDNKHSALIALADKPVRFTPESVKAEMNRTELD